MSSEIVAGSFSSSLAPQIEFYHAKKSDPPVSRGDPSTQQDTGDPSTQQDTGDLSTKQDTVDLSTKQSSRELQFVMDPKTKKVVAKVVDPKTHETIRQIPDKGVQQFSNSLGRYMGKTFSLAV